MNIKNSKLWIFLRKKYYVYLKKKHYKKASRMNKSDYEEYLVKRYSLFMNKHKYTQGKILSLNNPKTFSEKSQWLKLYDQDSRKNILSDKFLVREHIKKMLGEEYLIPIITIDGRDKFLDAFDIDFNKLPNAFVLKCNHGSHMNIVIKDKSALSKKNITMIKKQLNKWLKIDYTYFVSLETQYSNISPCIYIEEYIDFGEKPRDYKFLCFNGKCHYFWINENVLNNDIETCTTFNCDLSVAPFNMNLGFRQNISDLSLPNNIDKMIDIANKLAQDFIFSRIDLYNLNGKILFGEITFNSAAGYDVPYPEKYDLELGNLMLIDLDKRKNNKDYRKSK